MSRSILVVALLLCAPAARGALAQRPDFSGDWTLDRTRSALEFPPLARVDSALVRITHTETRFTFFRRFVVGGQPDTLSWTLVPGGPVDTTSDGDQRSFSRLRWEGDTLLLEVRIEAPRGVAGDTVRYRLLEGGRVLEARERFRAPRVRYDNVWVLTRT